MGSYRNSLDITADILQVVSQKPKKTQIMFRANLSYKVLQKYLKKITDASLIIFEKDEQCYMLTIKGKEFLESYQDYIKTHKNLKKSISSLNKRQKTLEQMINI